MKKFLVNSLAASVIALTSAKAVADDELVVYVFKDAAAAEGITVRLDGDEEESLSKAGAATFDLSGGGHSVQLIQDGETIHSFRFDSVSGQLVDINVLISGDDVKVAVESFFAAETAVERSKAPKGTLRGFVSGGGYSVSDATVTIEETGASVSTGDDGSYEFQLPRGLYSLSVEHPDFDDAELDDVRVVSNVTKGVNVTLKGEERPSSGGLGFQIEIAQPVIEELTVLGVFNSDAFELSERFTTNVVDTLDIEAIARFGDSDVAGSVVRLPSVTIQEDNFVFIRGLGGRYVTTTLNGATMPGTNPNKRSVPLDLFPSNMVSQLDVKKTFEAQMPGESTGGNLVINTRTFPDEFEGKFSFSVGYNNAITGETVASDPSSGDYDWLGFDDGSRAEPLEVRGIAILLDPALALGLNDTVVNENGNPISILEDGEAQFRLSDRAETELRRVAALSLTDNFVLEEATATPDISAGLQFGNLFYIGDQELGFFASLNYKNEWSTRVDGERNSYSVTGDRLDDFDFAEYGYNVDLSGLLSIGYVVGSHTYETNTVFSRVTEGAVRESEGVDGDSFEPSYRYTIRWEERQFFSQQLRGEHLLGDAENWTANWQATGSVALRTAPDRRDVVFNEVQSGVWNLEIPELTRRFDDLQDINFDGSFDFEWVLPATDFLESTLKFGAQHIFRDRDSETAEYGFNFTALTENPNFNVAPNRLVADVINNDNVTGNPRTGLAFQNKTQKSDSYSADMTLSSGFFSLDALLAGEFQIVLGARFEDFELNTRTFELGNNGAFAPNTLEEDVLLPTLNMNWSYSEEQQLRLALSKTVSRPDFRERSNAVYYDEELNARVRGNPDLQNSEVVNADIRWESYWGDANTFSVAAFYKEFTDAIERVVQPASGSVGNSRTFENSPEGELYGIEIDGRYEFALNSAYTQSIFIASNLSWIESEVTTIAGEIKRLQGAPEYSFNFVIGWDDLKNEQELTLLFNQNGETTIDRGRSGTPDIVVEPVADVNLNYKKSFGEELSISLKLKNILDSDVESTQGGQTFLKYNRGAELSAGFDWKF